MNEQHPIPSQRFAAAALKAMSGVPGEADRLAAAADVAGRVEQHYRSISTLLQGTETGDQAGNQVTEWVCAAADLRMGEKRVRKVELMVKAAAQALGNACAQARLRKTRRAGWAGPCG